MSSDSESSQGEIDLFFCIHTYVSKGYSSENDPNLFQRNSQKLIQNIRKIMIFGIKNRKNLGALTGDRNQINRMKDEE